MVSGFVRVNPSNDTFRAVPIVRQRNESPRSTRSFLSETSSDFGTDPNSTKHPSKRLGLSPMTFRHYRRGLSQYIRDAAHIGSCRRSSRARFQLVVPLINVFFLYRSRIAEILSQHFQRVRTRISFSKRNSTLVVGSIKSPIGKIVVNKNTCNSETIKRQTDAWQML